MLIPTVEQLRSVYTHHNYVWSELGTDDVNVFAIRKPRFPFYDDKWQDTIGIVQNERVIPYLGTTIPSPWWVKNHDDEHMNCCRVLPGQYRGAWRFGMHRGFPALVQCGQITVQLIDGDGADTVQISGAGFGVDVHRGSGGARIGLDSDGCLVIRDPTDYIDFLNRAERSRKYGERVTVTLFTETDFQCLI